jgi:maltose O-acetyltransferase
LLYRSVFGVDIPRDSTLYWRCRFFDPSGVHIGHNSIVGNDAYLDGRNGIYIGNNVSIAAQVLIFTKEHDPTSPTFDAVGGSVFIEDRVYIGSRVTILPNVRVGVGAVIASGAVVTRNVEPWTVVGGVPAKFIKQRPVVNYVLDTSRKILFQ